MKRRKKKAGTAKTAQAPRQIRYRITVEAQEESETLESIRWHEYRPPAVADVLEMLSALEEKLSSREKEIRKKAFAQAREHVVRLAKVGLIAPPKQQFSFPQPPLKGGRRVDINIFEGRFISDEE